MADFLFVGIDFSLKWIIPLVTYIAAVVYAVTTVGNTKKKIGALILGFLIFAGLVVIVLVLGLEDYLPSIELKEHRVLVVFSMLFGIVLGILFVIIAEKLIEHTENLFLAVTIALSLSTFFLHLYLFQIRIVLGAITLGTLIGVFGKLYAIGPNRKSGDNWQNRYK